MSHHMCEGALLVKQGFTILERRQSDWGVDIIHVLDIHLETQPIKASRSDGNFRNLKNVFAKQQFFFKWGSHCLRGLGYCPGKPFV